VLPREHDNFGHQRKYELNDFCNLIHDRPLLEMIEVQSVLYLGEGDWVRFEDIYGRRAGVSTFEH